MRTISKKLCLPILVIVLQLTFSLSLNTEAMTYTPLEGEAYIEKVTSTTTIPQFLEQIFQFTLAVAAALAVIMIVAGGVQTMLSESVFAKDEGKKRVKNAIYGLLLALVSWFILYTINPYILNMDIKVSPSGTTDTGVDINEVLDNSTDTGIDLNKK